MELSNVVYYFVKWNSNMKSLTDGLGSIHRTQRSRKRVVGKSSWEAQKCILVPLVIFSLTFFDFFSLTREMSNRDKRKMTLGTRMTTWISFRRWSSKRHNYSAAGNIRPEIKCAWINQRSSGTNIIHRETGRLFVFVIFFFSSNIWSINLLTWPIFS